MRLRSLITFGLAMLTILAGAAPARADQAPDYGAFGAGTFLSYVNAPPSDGDIDTVPKLTISFRPGASYPVEMDTGSTGLVVSADQVPTLEGRPCDECLAYSSSGKMFSGVWVTVPVTIQGGNGAMVTTTPIPVLAVTRITCVAHARRCTQQDHPKGVDVMGVGFAREHDHMADSTPDTNPFLNIAAARGAPMRRGYVAARTGVHVGLTRANTRGDFHFVKLAPDLGIAGEWQAAPACITVDAPAPAACGSLLVDTGVTSMFLTVPPAAVAGDTGTDGTLAGGTRLDLAFPGRDGSTEASYGFVVGSTGDRLAPAAVHLNTTRAPFVNTGVRFLNGFDVLYDADGGFFAFRPRPAGASARP
jgi:hypothetical protein